jgi:hypothetical protein
LSVVVGVVLASIFVGSILAALLIVFVVVVAAVAAIRIVVRPRKKGVVSAR